MSGSPARARVVLVTGASSGIGLATAVAASRAGDHVVLAARDEAALQRAEDLCRAAGAASTRVVPTDVGEDDDVRRCVVAALEVTGHLDVVVNVAGVVSYGRTEVIPLEVFEPWSAPTSSGRSTWPGTSYRSCAGSSTAPSRAGGLGDRAHRRARHVALRREQVGRRALARQLQLENRYRRGLNVVYRHRRGGRAIYGSRATTRADAAGHRPR